jgi:hypothetical protein
MHATILRTYNSENSDDIWRELIVHCGDAGLRGHKKMSGK